MGNDLTIHVRPPLREVRAALKRAGGNFTKKLRIVNKEIAERVADATRGKYVAAHQPQSGEGQQSIKAYATQTRAQVSLGKPTVPYVLGQNFGSNQAPNVDQFPPRPAGQPDYFLYRTIAEERDAIERAHAEAVDSVMAEAFPGGRLGGLLD